MKKKKVSILVMKVSYSANDGGGGNDGTTHGRTVRKLTSDSKAKYTTTCFSFIFTFFLKKRLKHIIEF